MTYVHGDTTNREIGASALAVIIILAMFWLMVSCQESSRKEEFLKESALYETLVVNGEEYSTEEIKYVTYELGIYQEDLIIVTLKDETVIRIPENGYTLKDRK